MRDGYTLQKHETKCRQLLRRSFIEIHISQLDFSPDTTVVFYTSSKINIISTTWGKRDLLNNYIYISSFNIFMQSRGAEIPERCICTV